MVAPSLAEPSPHVIVCLKDARHRSLFSLLLTDQGCQVTSCEDQARALQAATEQPAALCVMAAGDNPEGLLRALSSGHPGTRVFLLAESHQTELLPRLFKLGVDEMIFLPVNARRCVEVLRTLLMSEPPGVTDLAVAPRREGGVPSTPAAVKLASARDGETDPAPLPAQGQAMRTLLRKIETCAPSVMTLILQGEQGCEFELLARHFHRSKGGSPGHVDGMPAEQLCEETLRNVIALGRLGTEASLTLHLWGLERLNAAQQSDLCAILVEERRRRTRGKPVNFVLSFATHQEGEIPFIEELLFHTPLMLTLPPLRDHREDIPPMAVRALAELGVLYPELGVRRLERSALDWLAERTWPGNHCEFMTVLRTAVLSCTTPTLTATHLERCLADMGQTTKPAVPCLLD